MNFLKKLGKIYLIVVFMAIVSASYSGNLNFQELTHILFGITIGIIIVQSFYKCSDEEEK